MCRIEGSLDLADQRLAGEGIGRVRSSISRGTAAEWAAVGASPAAIFD